MSLTIPQVRSWTLSDLTTTATGLRSGATTLSSGAVSLINGFAGLTPDDWDGDTRDRAKVDGKDHAQVLEAKAKRWNNAATVLDEAAEQMGLLRTAILDIKDDPDNKRMYLIADDGNVDLTEEYAESLKTREDQRNAEMARATLETSLRSLLATAELAGNLYDQNTTRALLGESFDLTYTPTYFPPQTALPTDPKTDANADGSGPNQYNTDHPDWNHKLLLQRTKLIAEAGISATDMPMPFAASALQHFLDGSGTTMKIPVDNMLYDMPWFKDAAQAQTRATVATAIAAMPAGYKGPVAFQSDYSNTRPDGSPARPSLTSNPDWWATVGTFSYQSSGIATPTSEGNYTVSSRTSIYDYYNYETTQPNRSGYPQASDLNNLHRAGWAQNFDTVGTSS